jgi:MoaD family protein
MKVILRFFTVLKEITKKNKEELEVSHNTTLEDLLGLLAKKYGHQFRSYVYAENGKPKPHLQFLVNWINITTLNGFKTRLNEHDEIAIISPVSGG